MLTHSFLNLVNRVNPVHFFFPRSLVAVSVADYTPSEEIDLLDEGIDRYLGIS